MSDTTEGGKVYQAIAAKVQRAERDQESLTNSFKYVQAHLASLGYKIVRQDGSQIDAEKYEYSFYSWNKEA